jgi:hypothetical protein
MRELPYETDNPKKPLHVTVIHLGPITSPLLAGPAAIIEEFRANESAEENWESGASTAPKRTGESRISTYSRNARRIAGD